MKASPGAGLAFGFQVWRRIDRAGHLSPASGSLELLLATEDQVGDAVRGGTPKSRIGLLERCTGPAMTQPTAMSRVGALLRNTASCKRSTPWCSTVVSRTSVTVKA